MATPWDRITDETYKSWLLEAMTIEDYNGSSPRDRRLLLSDFEQQQQQQQQQQQVGSVRNVLNAKQQQSAVSSSALAVCGENTSCC
jgi:hypothetical protein